MYSHGSISSSGSHGRGVSGGDYGDGDMLGTTRTRVSAGASLRLSDGGRGAGDRDRLC